MADAHRVTEFDVLIAGGGLAGLSLSILLAKMGKSVVVLERQHYPIQRVCGEYISMESWSFLERLGLPLSSMNLPRIHELVITSAMGNKVTAPLHPGGFGISRLTLDHRLATVARNVGVTVLEGIKVEHIDHRQDNLVAVAGRQRFSARVAVGAFGKRSGLDHLSDNHENSPDKDRNTNWVGVKYHLRSDLPSHQIALHNFKNGYAGISRVDEDKSCFCYLTTAANLKRFGGTIQKMEEGLLCGNPWLRQILANRDQFVDQRPETISQIRFTIRPPVTNHILLAGDAAGMIAPLCGNGMSMAFRSANLLHLLVAEFLDRKTSRNQLEDFYKQSWKKNFQAQLRFGLFLQPILLSRGFSGISTVLLKRFPFLIQWMVRQTHGKPF